MITSVISWELMFLISNIAILSISLWPVLEMIPSRLAFKFISDTSIQMILTTRLWNLSFSVSETPACFMKWNCSLFTNTLMCSQFSRWISWLTFTWRYYIELITRWIQCYHSSTPSSMLSLSTESLGKLPKREFIHWSPNVLCWMHIFRNRLTAIFWNSSIFLNFINLCLSQYFTWQRERIHLILC